MPAASPGPPCSCAAPAPPSPTRGQRRSRPGGRRAPGSCDSCPKWGPSSQTTKLWRNHISPLHARLETSHHNNFRRRAFRPRSLPPDIPQPRASADTDVTEFFTPPPPNSLSSIGNFPICTYNELRHETRRRRRRCRRKGREGKVGGESCVSVLLCIFLKPILC